MAVLTEEQSLIQGAAKSWVREQSPISAFRAMRDSGNPLGFDERAWKDQVEMGWSGVIIPEAYGGSDLGFVSFGLILEEMGRTLTATPLLASGLAAASAIILGGDEKQKNKWLPKIADGYLVATLAVDETPRHAPEAPATIAVKQGAAYQITGRKVFVMEGPAADLFIVSAQIDGAGGVSLFSVRADASGVARQNLKLIDSRGFSNVTFEDAHGELLGVPGGGWPVLDATLDRARAGMAAEMLGAAMQAFEITLDYLKVRVQFGRPIGSFQALQHRAADMLTKLELARSAVEAALQAIDADSAEAPELVSLAKTVMGGALQHVTNEMIQMHGGIGMTDEHDAGFFLKRARVCEAVFGNQAYHRDRYARILGY